MRVVYAFSDAISGIFTIWNYAGLHDLLQQQLLQSEKAESKMRSFPRDSGMTNMTLFAMVGVK